LVIPLNMLVWSSPVSMLRFSMWRGISLVMNMTGSDALYASATPGNMWVLPTLGASQTPGLLVNLEYPSAMKALLLSSLAMMCLISG